MGKEDHLVGLKENVIIGKLIPVGTGMKRYRNTRLSTDVADSISFDEDLYADEALDPSDEKEYEAEDAMLKETLDKL